MGTAHSGDMTGGTRKSLKGVALAPTRAEGPNSIEQTKERLRCAAALKNLMICNSDLESGDQTAIDSAVAGVF